MQIPPRQDVQAAFQQLQQFMSGLTHPPRPPAGPPSGAATPTLPPDSNQIPPRGWDRGIDLGAMAPVPQAPPSGDLTRREKLARDFAALEAFMRSLTQLPSGIGTPNPIGPILPPDGVGTPNPVGPLTPPGVVGTPIGAPLPGDPMTPTTPASPPAPITGPAPVTPLPAPTTPNAGAYTTLVGQGTQSYREVYAPTSAAMTPANGEVSLRTMHGNLEGNRLKLFVPPGTKRFSVSFVTYNSPEPASASARFKQQPTGTAEDARPDTAVMDTRRTLSRLLNGEELQFYSPPSSGGLSIANSQSDDTFVGSEGGYIYIDLHSVPGGKILQLQTRLDVDEAAYRNWYQNAEWDAAGNPRDT